MNPYEQIPPPSPAAAYSAERLYSDIKKAFPGLVADFDSKWTAWTKTWFPNETPNNSSMSPLSSRYILSSDADASASFSGIKEEGRSRKKGVQLTKTSLQRLRSLFAIDNELERDKEYLVNPADPINYKFLQRQANLIVDMNFDRNRVVQARIEAWKAHCTRNQIHSSSGIYTKCEEYDKLLELGGSIIAHLMVGYSGDQTGFWYELLHEIVHDFGKKTGLQTVDFKKQYFVWNEWVSAKETQQGTLLDTR
ncbi:unnamed protein product [Cyclocybe aegerita]|uniref:Uncharacterized protein n=1 Tax=Cyclocybe aegerita TaxID=1973307 RepID=A0A8S0WGI7_CYCAE|nr:unnamed protein product [Cyclocybe aegerita]